MTALLLFAVSVMGLEARAEPWDRNLRWSLDYALDGQQVFSGRQGFGSLHIQLNPRLKGDELIGFRLSIGEVTQQTTISIGTFTESWNLEA